MKNLKLAICSLLTIGTIASAQLSPINTDSTYDATIDALSTAVAAGNWSPDTEPAADGWVSGGVAPLLGSTNTGSWVEQWDIIMIGEDGSWKNDLNILLNLNADGSFGGSSTALNVFDSVNYPTSVGKGDYRRLTVHNSLAGIFDLQLDSSDASDAGGAYGGQWRMFYPTYNNPAAPSFDYGWGTATKIPDFYLFAFEDWNTDPALTVGQNGDDDRNDFVFALKYVGMTQVPEPSTYGIIGALALLGLIATRRMKKA